MVIPSVQKITNIVMYKLDFSMLRSSLWMKFFFLNWWLLKRARSDEEPATNRYRFRLSVKKLQQFENDMTKSKISVFCDFRFLISSLELTAISKRFRIGGSNWAHFLRLFEIIPAIMNFFPNFQQCKGPQSAEIDSPIFCDHKCKILCKFWYCSFVNSLYLWLKYSLWNFEK